jgi:hypothetical protein
LAEARAKWIAAKIGDRTLRDVWIRAITENPQDYSEAERKQIQEGLDMEAQVITNSSALKPIKISTTLLDKAVAMTSKDGQHNIVQSSATIRAPLMAVVAYTFCAEQESNNIMAKEWSTLVNKVLEQPSDHSIVFHWGSRLPRPLRNRDAVFSVVTQKLGDSDQIISFQAIDHAGAVQPPNTVRATGTRLLRFSQVTPTVTRFTATSTFDLHGSIPRFVSDSLTTPGAARAPLSALGYFVQTKETAEVDAAGQDARALGQLLVHEMEPVRTKMGGDQLEAKLHVFFYRTTVLRELVDVHPWFELLLLQVLRNQASLVKQVKEAEEPVPSGNSGIRGGASRANSKMKGLSSSLSSVGAKTKKLADFTERDAVITGRAMKMLMLSNATPDAAVDEVSRERSG